MIRSALRPAPGALLACSVPVILLAFAFSPAQAAPHAAYYQATLVAKLDQPRKDVVDGVVWNCAGDSCAGTQSGSRAVIVCGRLAHRVGAIASFTVAGDALGTDDLATCNK